MRYVVARYNDKQRETAYRIYCTDCLKMIARNTARMTIEGGVAPSKRYAELIGLSEPEKEETRTADEIISSISAKLNKLGGEQNS